MFSVVRSRRARWAVTVTGLALALPGEGWTAVASAAPVTTLSGAWV